MYMFCTSRPACTIEPYMVTGKAWQGLVLEYVFVIVDNAEETTQTHFLPNMILSNSARRDAAR